MSTKQLTEKYPLLTLVDSCYHECWLVEGKSGIYPNSDIEVNIAPIQAKDCAFHFMSLVFGQLSSA